MSRSSSNKALIKVGYACNNVCIFCHTTGSAPARDSAARVAAKIDRAAELGHDMVVLSGGEPTLRPELLEWAAHAASKGLDFGLVTNARGLARRGVVDGLVANNLRFVHLSLHGGCAEVHDRMVGAPAFGETLAALDNLAGRGLELTAACVVTRANIGRLREVVDLLRPFSDVWVKFAFTEPKGAAAAAFDDIVPPIAAVGDAVADGIRYGQRNRGGQCFAHEGIPLCVVAGLEDLATDLGTYGFTSMSEAFEDDFFPVDTRNRAHTERCGECDLAGQCAGLFNGYVDRRGDGELRPRAFVDDAKLRAREAAANEEHTWVRLTQYCNNHCAFCLDSASHDGGAVPAADVRRRILDGKNRGATRLILSGGEATLHPKFAELVRFGNQLNFRKVQTITNGRRFAYPKFLHRCLDAGLNEITFSIHGHTAALHDRLVGVPGAFEQAVAGLSAALADGRPVVNVDVCLNRLNIDHLPALLDRLIALGVREFDLLHLIPFGRAHGDDTLYYDIDAAMPAIRYALALSRRPNLHIWFNRFPAPYLEGFEHLIQDPSKLHDEVRGRRLEMERWVTDGVPLSCRSAERCALCYLEGLCDDLEEQIERVATGAAPWIRVHGSEGDLHLPPIPVSPQGTWLEAANVEVAATLIPSLPGSDLILDLNEYDGLTVEMLGGRRLLRAYARRPADVDALLTSHDRLGSFEVVAYLTGELAGHLVAAHPEGHPRLALAAPTFGRMTEARAAGADLGAFFAAYGPRPPCENIPPCISGQGPRPLPAFINARMVRDDGCVDLVGFTTHHIADNYFTKSHRCGECVHDGACRGVHVNTVRAFGYGVLQPIASEDRDSATSAATLDSAAAVHR